MRASHRLALAAGFSLLVLAILPAAVQAQWYMWYPTAPALPPYAPPMGYGPGNHYPHPFQPYYPGHPHAQYYWPYTYTPFSGYYSYPTVHTYRDTWNPYYPRPIGPLGAPVIAPAALPIEALPNKPAEVKPNDNNKKDAEDKKKDANTKT